MRCLALLYSQRAAGEAVVLLLFACVFMCTPVHGAIPEECLSVYQTDIDTMNDAVESVQSNFIVNTLYTALIDGVKTDARLNASLERYAVNYSQLRKDFLATITWDKKFYSEDDMIETQSSSVFHKTLLHKKRPGICVIKRKGFVDFARGDAISRIAKKMQRSDGSFENDDYIAELTRFQRARAVETQKKYVRFLRPLWRVLKVVEEPFVRTLYDSFLPKHRTSVLTAKNRLGGLVVPFAVVEPGVYVQKISVPAKDRMVRAIKNNNVQELRDLVDQYIQLRLALWRRGVTVRGYSLNRVAFDASGMLGLQNVFSCRQVREPGKIVVSNSDLLFVRKMQQNLNAAHIDFDIQTYFNACVEKDWNQEVFDVVWRSEKLRSVVLVTDFRHELKAKRWIFDYLGMSVHPYLAFDVKDVGVPFEYLAYDMSSVENLLTKIPRTLVDNFLSVAKSAGYDIAVLDVDKLKTAVRCMVENVWQHEYFKTVGVYPLFRFVPVADGFDIELWGRGDWPFPAPFAAEGSGAASVLWHTVAPWGAKAPDEFRGPNSGEGVGVHRLFEAAEAVFHAHDGSVAISWRNDSMQYGPSLGGHIIAMRVRFVQREHMRDSFVYYSAA